MSSFSSSSDTPLSQVTWSAPNSEGSFRTGLKVKNSLKNRGPCCSQPGSGGPKNDCGLVEFLPINGRTVKWYGCGPTVCDPPNLGHCRTYMTFDVVRRVLEDYFMYNVTHVMGVTDIDDRIIIRTQEIRELVEEGWSKNDAMTALSSTGGGLEDARQELIASCKKRRKETPDNANSDGEATNISSNILTKEMEVRFFNDLARLHIRPPTVITRVTEFIPSIITFITNIIDNGFAYVTGDSVYFDVQKFGEMHKYAKLMSRCSDEDQRGVLTKNCEGALQCNEAASKEKKHPKDFILWRKSNDGEPQWNSPWGEGRPGWHIECSAMASEYLGDCIDLHTGCEDLRFPHHDNELAQSEARWNNHQWVNYFLHHGNIHADSKDLFSTTRVRPITIDDILTIYTARQIRILFLLHPYQDALILSKGSMSGACKIEAFFAQFFGTTETILGQKRWKAEESVRWNDTEENFESTLLKEFDTTERLVHEALCNNFDTPTAMKHLQSLASATLRYIAGREDSGGVRLFLLHKPVQYIKKLFRVFGLLEEDGAFTNDKPSAASRPTTPIPEPKESKNFEKSDVREVIDAFLHFKQLVKGHLTSANAATPEAAQAERVATLKAGGASAPGRMNAATPSSAPPAGRTTFLDCSRSADCFRENSLLNSDLDERDLQTLSSGLNNFTKYFSGANSLEEEESLDDDDIIGDGVGDCIPVIGGGAAERKEKRRRKRKPTAQPLKVILDLFKEFEEETLPGVGMSFAPFLPQN